MRHPTAKQCTATAKTTGVRCEQPVVAGSNVCRYHGGRAPQVRKAAARRLALAQAEAMLAEEQGRLRLGDEVEVEPADAMLATVREAAANVGVLRQLVQTLPAEVARPAEISTPDGPITLGDYQPGLAVVTGSTAKPNEAAPHVWVVMYDAERERLMRWAKACRDAGVDERRIQVAEQQGREIVDVLRTFTTMLLTEVTAASPSLARDLEAKIPGLLRTAIETVVDTTASEAP